MTHSQITGVFLRPCRFCGARITAVTGVHDRSETGGGFGGDWRIGCLFAYKSCVMYILYI